LCWCGRRGCLEIYAGGDGMLRRLGRSNSCVNSMTRLVEQARAGDEDVLAVVAEGARALGRALTNVALVLNPSTIVLGGELAALGALLADPIRAELATVPFGVPIRLRVSALGERASLVGALAVVLTESSRFADRSGMPTGSYGSARQLPN
jgi:predicted NBD/HSP70 family sugar kinase